MPELNIGNSIFKNLNDNNGLMLCGYEWGLSKDDQRAEDAGEIKDRGDDVIFTFSNKSLRYGDRAYTWKYDNRIINWFKLWGHPLNRNGLGDNFDQCILQTNWCNTQDNKVEGDYHSKLLSPDQIDNFIFHIEKFKSKLIIFFGSKIIDILQSPIVMDKFQNIMGAITSPLEKTQKNFEGIKFYISFQEFEHCNIVCLPHPSGTHGLSDSYIELYKGELSNRINLIKSIKGIC